MHILDYTESEISSTCAKLGYECPPLERFQEIQHENVIFMIIETIFGNSTKEYISNTQFGCAILPTYIIILN